MIIRLKGLRFFAFHGVHPEERTLGRWFEVDIAIETAHNPGIGDDLRLTLDYAGVADFVKMKMALPRNLLETLVSDIGEGVLKEYPMAEIVKVRVSKLLPPLGVDCDSVTVEDEFKR